MKSKSLDIIRMSIIMMLCLAVLLFFYLLMENATIQSQEKKQLIKARTNELVDDAFIMGAAMYRAQVVKTLDDSTIVKLDSLFIQEVRDFNDTLAIKVREEIE